MEEGCGKREAKAVCCCLLWLQVGFGKQEMAYWMDEMLERMAAHVVWTETDQNGKTVVCLMTRQLQGEKAMNERMPERKCVKIGVCCLLQETVVGTHQHGGVRVKGIEKNTVQTDVKQWQIEQMIRVAVVMADEAVMSIRVVEP